MRKLKDCFPPDAEWKAEKAILIMMYLTLVVVWGIWQGPRRYITDFRPIIRMDFAYTVTEAYEEMHGATISFGQVIEYAQSLFVMYAAICIACGIYHHRLFRERTKSIYLMKRIPDYKKEMFIRCWSVPLTALAIGLVTAILLQVPAYIMYLNDKPDWCEPFTVMFEFWHAFKFI